MVRGFVRLRAFSFIPLRCLFVLMLLVVGVSQHASADPMPAIEFQNPEIDYTNDISWSLGFEFEVWADVNVTSLGFYDAGADGFLEDHAVGLYDTFGTLLAATIINNDSLLAGLFRWESIAPVSLLAGQTYVVSGFGFLDPYTWDPYDASVDSRIYLSAGRYSDAEQLVFPEARISELLGFFGPNLMLTDPAEPPTGVPTPDGLVLLMMGLLLLCFVDKRIASWRSRLPVTTRKLTIIGFFFAASTPASSLELSATPVQGDNTWAGQVPLASRYQRYSHDNVGVIAEYDNVFDANGNYIVPVGEVLRWVWIRNDVTLAYLEYRYLGGPNRCWVTSTGVQSCGNLNKFLAFMKLKCLPEHGEYEVLFFRSGTEQLNHEFDTERFKIKDDPVRWLTPANLAPRQRSTDAQGTSGDLSFTLTDDLNCNQRLSDVRVSVEATIQNGTGGHTHFGTDTRGTGRFEALPGFNSDLTLNDTRIEGRTNSSGQYKARYVGLDYALTESARIVFLRPAESGHPENRKELTRNWHIRLDDFVIPNIVGHVREDGGTCPGHAPMPDFLTPAAAARLPGALDVYFNTAGGIYLGYNDASLGWGGKIDQGTRNSQCHLGHRMGIAIDIESQDMAGRDLRTGMFDGQALMSLLLDAMITGCFERNYASSGIHFDYDPGACPNEG